MAMDAPTRMHSQALPEDANDTNDPNATAFATAASSSESSRADNNEEAIPGQSHGKTSPVLPAVSDSVVAGEPASSEEIDSAEQSTEAREISARLRAEALEARTMNTGNVTGGRAGRGAGGRGGGWRRGRGRGLGRARGRGDGTRDADFDGQKKHIVVYKKSKLLSEQARDDPNELTWDKLVELEQSLPGYEKVLEDKMYVVEEHPFDERALVSFAWVGGRNSGRLCVTSCQCSVLCVGWVFLHPFSGTFLAASIISTAILVMPLRLTLTVLEH